jgi:tripeptidyl-peptidase-1
LATLLEPSVYTKQAVEKFLERFQVVNYQYTRSKDILSARLSLRTIQLMFNVTYSVYRHRVTGELQTGTFDSYSVPSFLADKIDFVTHIQGLKNLDKPNRKKNYDAIPTNEQIVPIIIRQRYNISSSLVITNANNSHAVAEFQAQFFSQTDLTQFFKTYVPYAPPNSNLVAKIIGQNAPTSPGVEASLDIQYLMGVAPNATTWFYSMASFNFYNDLITWLGELNNETQTPWLHTVSYGSQGNYPSNTYMTRSDTEYAKLGARGITIIYASGDSGAECKTQCKVFDPSYPAISPHVTAVGATRFCNGQNFGSECAVQAFGSGGGMAPTGTFAAPSFQTAPMANYFKTVKNLPPPGTFDETARGTPDFAALGDEKFQVIDGGRTVSVGGTSCSAPTFGAVMTLLNDILLNKKQSTLGYLNPTVYNWAQTVANSIFDVTVGDNEDGCSPATCAPYLNGYLCNPGWDPVTGFGTPNFAVLQTKV